MGNHLDDYILTKRLESFCLNDVFSDFEHKLQLAPVAYLPEKTHHIPLANQIYLR